MRPCGSSRACHVLGWWQGEVCFVVLQRFVLGARGPRVSVVSRGHARLCGGTGSRLAWVGDGYSLFLAFFLPLGPLCGGFAIPSVGLALPPDGLPHCFVSAWPPLLLLAGILHGRAAPSMAPSLPLRALPFRSPLPPLGLAILPHSHVKRSPCPPRRARGPRPPPGALPCVSPGGVRGPLSGSGRPAPPWVVGGSPAGPVGHAALPPCCAAPLAAIVTSSCFRGGGGALCVRTFRPPREGVGCVAFFFNLYFSFLSYAVPLSAVGLDPLCGGPAVAAFVSNRSLRGVHARSLFGPRGPWAGLSWQWCLLSSAPLSGWLCVTVLPCGGPLLRPCLVLLVVLWRGSSGVCPVDGSVTFLAGFPLDCLIRWLYSFWVARLRVCRSGL